MTEGEYLCAGNDVTMDTSQATKGRHVTRRQHSSHVPCLLDRVNITANNVPWSRVSAQEDCAWWCYSHPECGTWTYIPANSKCYIKTPKVKYSLYYISNDTAEVMSP